MKKTVLFLLLLITISVCGQQKYDQLWTKIKSEQKAGKLKSTLPAILQIQDMAKKDQNAEQLIKALQYEFSIINRTQDDEQNEVANQFFRKLETTTASLEGDSKLLLEALTPVFVQDYFAMHQWKIRQQTNVSQPEKAAIESWSTQDFKKYLLQQYSVADTKKQQYQNIKISDIIDVFEKRDGINYINSVYEWLAVRHIQFLKNQQFFTPAERRVNQEIITKIYDELITAAIGSARLYFKHEKLNDQCSFTNCKDKLQQLRQLLATADPADDYQLMIREDIVQQLIGKEEYVQALEEISLAKKMFPKSTLLNGLLNREKEIKNPLVTVHFENYIQAGKPAHLVAESKNASGFTLQLYQITDDVANFLKYQKKSYDEELFRSLKKKQIRKANFQTPAVPDYKLHRTSFKLEALPAGLYAGEYQIGAEKPKFFTFIVAESVALPYKTENKRESQYQLLLRENGLLLPNRALSFYEFNGKTTSVSTGRTDKSGLFSLPESKNNGNYRHMLIKDVAGNSFQYLQLYGDHGREPVFSNYDDGQLTKTQSQIFIDRQIFRPGQRVYFKVINTQLQGDRETVISNLRQKIFLYDANGDEISSQEFVTNDFGSYHGSFTLPIDKLTGQFSLQTDNRNSGRKYFSVEEYKRPNFEISFSPLTGEYAYGQKIELQGKATTYSGVPLINSRVQYEIKKRNIRWRYFWWYPPVSENENSILGETMTDASGNFTIPVMLEKDETLEGIQIDNYEFTASVTDISGETQTATESITVSSVSHYLTAELPENNFSDEKIEVKAEALNYNNQKLEKTYHVNLVKLAPPSRVFRSTFEEYIQDVPVMTKEEFVRNFPHDYYNKQEKVRPAEKVLMQSVRKTGNTFSLGMLEPGKYRLELFNIEGKDTIRTVKDFDVYNKRFLKDAQKPFLKVIPGKKSWKRNEKAQLFIYSAVPNAAVTIFTQNGTGETKVEEKKLNNGILIHTVTLPHNQSIHQIDVQVRLTAFNETQTQEVTLPIEAEQIPLKIETISFRDKMQPVEAEKWTLKITGTAGEKVNAELLAAMYDQSLDQFQPNSFSWETLKRNFYNIVSYRYDENLQSLYYAKRIERLPETYFTIPSFSWYGNRQFYSGNIMLRGAARQQMVMAEAAAAPLVETSMADSAAKKDAANAVADATLEKVPVRKNLNETAFFYPQLRTNDRGEVMFEFTAPEALTRWKAMFLAHTKDARAATLEQSVITQKELSVTPNYPRFLREGDQLVFKTRISSLVNQPLKGQAVVSILDAVTEVDVTALFIKENSLHQDFSLDAKGAQVITWTMQMPENQSAVIFKVVAKAGSFSDGEQKSIAILPNRMLVTEAIPVFVKEGETKTFTFDKLLNQKSGSAVTKNLTLELSTNPIWEILFALPSIKYDSNQSADVIFDKWFADVLAAEIFKANPKLQTVFDEYQKKELLTSPLEKNQELKQLLLEETPWLMESRNEAEQMQQIARLFDVNTMRNSLQTDWQQLQQLQNPDGGFSWYTGSPSSYPTSLYILKNLGKIKEWLGGDANRYVGSDTEQLTKALIQYVDKEFNRLMITETFKPNNFWSNMVLNYLDARRYFEQQYPLAQKGKEAKAKVTEYAPKAKLQDFTFYGLHRSALLLNAYGKKQLAKKFMTYLKETSVESKLQGAYWKQNANGWGWYQSEVINHAGALEAFEKITPEDHKFIEELKIWLATQKETGSWGSSRATAEVIFTMLNSGTSWTTSASGRAAITWGGKAIAPDTEATGFIKKTITGADVKPSFGTLTVSKPGPGVVQGGLYWQYFEDYNKVTPAANYVSVKRELYRKVKTENGEELRLLQPGETFTIGDRVTVRLILNTDRNMEYIHLKDLRPAGLEPLNVLSAYHWKNGLGYYQATKDASENFYIEQMPKGKYVFESDYIANAAGTFSGAITTLQNYYAPQMSAHTKGEIIVITE